MLLVLGGVAGDRPVAQLGQLDADLGGGDPVGSAADDRPVAPGRAPRRRRSGRSPPGGPAPAAWRRAGSAARRAPGRRGRRPAGLPPSGVGRGRRPAASRPRSGRRTPSSTPRSSRRRGRRRCRAPRGPWPTRSLLRRLTTATTWAPRVRARSTVRLVSVVVPDWLMATTSVSLMSSASPKPGQLGGGQGGAPTSVGQAARRCAAATACPATAAVPWPMTSTRRIVPCAEGSASAGGTASSPTRTVEPPVRRRRRSGPAGSCGTSRAPR